MKFTYACLVCLHLAACGPGAPSSPKPRGMPLDEEHLPGPERAVTRAGTGPCTITRS